METHLGGFVQINGIEATFGKNELLLTTDGWKYPPDLRAGMILYRQRVAPTEVQDWECAAILAPLQPEESVRYSDTSRVDTVRVVSLECFDVPRTRIDSRHKVHGFVVTQAGDAGVGASGSGDVLVSSPPTPSPRRTSSRPEADRTLEYTPIESTGSGSQSFRSAAMHTYTAVNLMPGVTTPNMMRKCVQ
jgi:hypothetical protein